MSASGLIAVVGGECSGKSTLARALAADLPALYVPETLREFVDDHGRPPRVDEQFAVMNAQIAAEEKAVGSAGWVVSDPGALMTAIYSIAYFDDASLVPAALARQSAYRLTVWCDVDFPWEADGNQRDGPAHRERVHQILGGVIVGHAVPVLRVGGPVEDRVAMVRVALGLHVSNADGVPNAGIPAH